MEAATASSSSSSSSAATVANTSSLSASQTNSSRNSSSIDTNGFTNLNENHRSFVYSLLSEEDRLLFDNIFNYREKLFSEIKELEDELSDVQNEIEQIDITDNDSKNNPKSKQISLGKKKFNIDPKQGMKFLLDSNLVENTAESVAQFLYAGEGLNKIAIGIYLGEKEELNLQVLKHYIELHDFHNKNLVESLREFLSNFQLPGESQKIDRIMELFSERFCKCNPNILSPDACFIISFATVMLNTLLHNPSIKDRQTCDQFLKMCRDGCKNEEIPEQLLKDIYNSIKREQFKLIHNDASEFMLTFNNPIREGWLWKQGGRYKVWQRRWFILNDGCLYYFEFTSDKEPKGIIPLENVNVREVDDRTKQFCFEIYSTTNDKIKACKHDSEGKVVEVGNHAVYRMSAATAEDKNEWIKRIRDCISENPLLNTTGKRLGTTSSSNKSSNGLPHSSGGTSSNGSLNGFNNVSQFNSTSNNESTLSTANSNGSHKASNASSLNGQVIFK